MHTYQSNLIGKGLKIGIVVSRFNEIVTENLLKGALTSLESLGVASEQISLAWVPGAFEIPLVAQQMAKKDFDAIITLGVVIRGETPHFDFVANEVSSGVSTVALKSEKPVVFGVLTTDTKEQALDRSGLTAGNKGADAAFTAVEMANLLGQIK